MSARWRFVRHLLWIGTAISGVLLAWIGLLAFPQVLCAQHVQAGSFVLYYDDMPRPEAEELARAVAHRLERNGYYDSSWNARAFVFQNPSTYALITRLAAQPGEAQGFNLSVLGNSFISAPRVAALGERSGGGPRYSIWEGDLSHTIAHEIAHQYLVDRLGRRELPQWKREGLAEYVANVGLIRADSTANLRSRVDVLHDDKAWRATPRGERQGWDRVHYEAGLLVEFLLDVQGYSLEEIVSESVTVQETRSALRAWADAEDSSASEPNCPASHSCESRDARGA